MGTKSCDKILNFFHLTCYVFKKRLKGNIPKDYPRIIPYILLLSFFLLFVIWDNYFSNNNYKKTSHSPYIFHGSDLSWTTLYLEMQASDLKKNMYFKLRIAYQKP